MNETYSQDQDENRQAPNLWAFLQEAAQLVKRHGCALVADPNGESLADTQFDQDSTEDYNALGDRFLQVAQTASRRFILTTPEIRREVLLELIKEAKLRDGILAVELKDPYKTMAEMAPRAKNRGESEIWLPAMDSNHDKQIQRLLSCH